MGYFVSVGIPECIFLDALRRGKDLGFAGKFYKETIFKGS